MCYSIYTVNKNEGFPKQETLILKKIKGMDMKNENNCN